MKYLILGSRGQIGEALVDYLQTKGHEVLEFDLINTADEDLRIHENQLLEAHMQEADFVFFLAFDVGGSRYLAQYQNTFDFIDNNTALMLNTFRALKKYNKRFVFASSQMSNMSYSSYGRAKALGESYTQILGGLVVKFWNVYGLEHDLEKAHVITDFILKAKQSKRIDMLTDGTEERQFLHATDCSRALEMLSEKYDEIPRDKELHATSFVWTTVLDVAKLVAAHFPGTEIVPAPAKDMVQLNKRNEPDDFIKTIWQPEIGIEEGVKDIVSRI